MCPAHSRPPLPARLPVPAPPPRTPPSRQVTPGQPRRLTRAGRGAQPQHPRGQGGSRPREGAPRPLPSLHHRLGRGLAREGRRRRRGGGGPGRPGCQGGGSGSGPAQRPRRAGGRRAGGRARRECPAGEGKRGRGGGGAGGAAAAGARVVTHSRQAADRAPPS